MELGTSGLNGFGVSFFCTVCGSSYQPEVQSFGVVAAGEQGEEGDREDEDGEELGKRQAENDRRVVGAEEFQEKPDGAVGESEEEEALAGDVAALETVGEENGDHQGERGFIELDGIDGERGGGGCG